MNGGMAAIVYGAFRMTTISSRTPEGRPHHCPICDAPVFIEPSTPPGDAPCPNCGQLLWFPDQSELETVLGTLESGGRELDYILGRTGSARGKSLALDLVQVTFIGSTLLGKLIVLDARLKSGGGRLELCNLGSDIREVFRICRLDRLFVIR